MKTSTEKNKNLRNFFFSILTGIGFSIFFSIIYVGFIDGFLKTLNCGIEPDPLFTDNYTQQFLEFYKCQGSLYLDVYFFVGLYIVFMLSARRRFKHLSEKEPIKPTNFVARTNISNLLRNVFIIYFDNFFTILIIATIHYLIYSSGLPIPFSFVTSIFACAIVIVCSRYVLNRPVKLGEIYKNLFWSKYVLHLLFGTLIITIFLGFPLNELPFLLGTKTLTDNIIIFSLYILLAQGLLFFVLFFYASIVLVEKQNFLNAFGRLFTLLSSYWKTIPLFIISFYVFYWLPTSILSSLTSADILVGSKFDGIVLIIFFPFLYISTVLLYYDARVRKENYNEELLAQEMGYEISTEVMSV